MILKENCYFRQIINIKEHSKFSSHAETQLKRLRFQRLSSWTFEWNKASQKQQNKNAEGSQ